MTILMRGKGTIGISLGANIGALKGSWRGAYRTCATMVAMYTPAVKGSSGMSASTRLERTALPTCGREGGGDGARVGFRVPGRFP